jgi:hypothetical protein|tara:strand:+ start:210 stop:869 length:660 start_codon:yes stop_codon:yes gene_type:complete
MGYFRELPNLEYQSPFSDRLSDSSYVLAKNLFRRMKIRDDLQNIFTIFDKYQIVDGSRPDTVADELYGNPNYDYVVLLTANITNIRDQWPITSKELYDYALKKYGIEKLNDTHHHVTKEIKDSNGKLILPAGKIVNSDFTVSYFDSTPITTSATETVRAISNYDFEVDQNEKKRTIYVLKPIYLGQFLDDMKNEMIYRESSQFVNRRLIRTENTRVTIP